MWYDECVLTQKHYHADKVGKKRQTNEEDSKIEGKNQTNTTTEKRIR